MSNYKLEQQGENIYHVKNDGKIVAQFLLFKSVSVVYYQVLLKTKRPSYMQYDRYRVIDEGAKATTELALNTCKKALKKETAIKV